MMRSILIAVMVATVALPLAGCGRKGMPYEPEDAVYPRVYPYTPQPNAATKDTGPQDQYGDPAYQPPKPRPPATTPDLNFRNGY